MSILNKKSWKKAKDWISSISLILGVCLTVFNIYFITADLKNKEIETNFKKSNIQISYLVSDIDTFLELSGDQSLPKQGNVYINSIYKRIHMNGGDRLDQMMKTFHKYEENLLKEDCYSKSNFYKNNHFGFTEIDVILLKIENKGGYSAKDITVNFMDKTAQTPDANALNYYTSYQNSINQEYLKKNGGTESHVKIEILDSKEAVLIPIGIKAEAWHCEKVDELMIGSYKYPVNYSFKDSLTNEESNNIDIRPIFSERIEIMKGLYGAG